MSFRIASRRLATPASSYSRRASSSGFRYFASVTTTSGDASTQGDPMEIFDMIDTNKDGILSKEEFRSAVSMMHYEDLLKMRTSLSRNELSYNSAAD
jgi:Ca2+-binding EF-hand superfamily protein